MRSIGDILTLPSKINRIGFINCCALIRQQEQTIAQNHILHPELKSNEAQLLIKPWELERGVGVRWWLGRWKKGTTIFTTGIICSSTLPAPDVRGLRLDRDFQRPSSFQPKNRSVTGELPRTLTISQRRTNRLLLKWVNSKNYQLETVWFCPRSGSVLRNYLGFQIACILLGCS